MKPKNKEFKDYFPKGSWKPDNNLIGFVKHTKEKPKMPTWKSKCRNVGFSKNKLMKAHKFIMKQPKPCDMKLPISSVEKGKPVIVLPEELQSPPKGEASPPKGEASIYVARYAVGYPLTFGSTDKFLIKIGKLCIECDKNPIPKLKLKKGEQKRHPIDPKKWETVND